LAANRKLTLADFWQLIDDARRNAGTDAQFTATLRKLLAERSPDENRQFKRLLGERLAEAYRWDLWAAAHVLLKGCGDDAFDAFRAWLVSQGRERYDEVLASPVTLRNHLSRHMENEELLALADLREHPSKPRGKAWKEHELPKRFPELFPDDKAVNKVRRLSAERIAQLDALLAWGRGRLAPADSRLPSNESILAAFPGAKTIVPLPSPAHVGFAGAWLVAPEEVDPRAAFAVETRPLLERVLGKSRLGTVHPYRNSEFCDGAVDDLTRVAEERLAASVQATIARRLISPLRSEGEQRHLELLSQVRETYRREDLPHVPFETNARLVNFAAIARFLDVPSPFVPIVSLDIGAWCLAGDVVLVSPQRTG
jgi:hypothetical protein